jgi:hypothetical protein
VPDFVTCCFTLNEALAQMLVDEQDVTSQVQGVFANRSSTKYVSFIEPPGPAVLAVKGRDTNEILLPSLLMRCQVSHV